jgi:hypothetical protein
MKSAEELQAELDAEKAARASAEQERDALKSAEETRAAQFAAAEKARRANEDKAVLDAVVAEGKVTPAERDDLAKLFEALPTEAMTFAAGDKEPREALADFLKGLPKRATIGKGPVSPTEFTAGDTSAAQDAEKAALAARNERLQSAHRPTVQ